MRLADEREGEGTPVPAAPAPWRPLRVSDPGRFALSGANGYNRTGRRRPVQGQGGQEGRRIIPGDSLALIEECEAGANTFDDGDRVRAAAVGTAEYSTRDRTAGVATPVQMHVPDIGDTVVGTVAIVMSSMFAVAIRYINGRPVTSNVECVCSTRDSRRRMVAMIGDVVALRILSRINGTIHATVDDPELGVLFTKCRMCGMGVIAVRDGVKCAECGWFDERNMSSNFGKAEAAISGRSGAPG